MSVVVPFHRPQDNPPAPSRSGPGTTPPAPPAPPAGRAPRRAFATWRDMALADVIAELGLGAYATRTAIDKLRALAVHSGMPLPRNPRTTGGVPATGADNICARSIWDRGEWLAWRDFHRSGTNAIGKAPPAPSEREQARLRERLANRARAGAGGAA